MREDGRVTFATRYAGFGLCLAALCAALDLLRGPSAGALGAMVGDGANLSLLHVILAAAAIAYLAVGERSVAAACAAIGRTVRALIERFDGRIPDIGARHPAQIVCAVRPVVARHQISPSRRGPPSVRFVF
jgi:hypothetical protein